MQQTVVIMYYLIPRSLSGYSTTLFYYTKLLNYGNDDDDDDSSYHLAYSVNSNRLYRICVTLCIVLLCGSVQFSYLNMA